MSQRMTKQWHGGKGSSRRSTANNTAYEDNWDKIFGKKKKVKDGKEENKDSKRK
jgi:hypothetical protein